MSEAVVNVTFFDTTARDGAQSLPEANQFPPGSKIEVIDHIAQLGVGVIEAGFPASRDDEGVLVDLPDVQEVAERIGNRAYSVKHWQDGIQTEPEGHIPVIAGLTRVLPKDIDITWEAIKAAARPRIHTFISTDPEHMAAKFAGKTPEQVLAMGRAGVRYAIEVSADHPGANVEFSAEAYSTTDVCYAERVFRTALDEGASVVNGPDTVGQKNPFQMYQKYMKLIGWVMQSNPDATISSHPHNDLGMAVANSYALVAAAADYAAQHERAVNIQLETTICGVGERAGNADIFPVAAGLFKFTPDMPVPVRWSFNPEQSVSVARAVMGIAGLTVNRQSPIVGSDTNVHRSGIHSDGIIKGGHKIYTPFDPRFWGHEQAARHEEGRYQGRKGMAAARA